MDLYQIYYRSASALIFMYNPTNRKSFDQLSTKIDSILEVIPREQFFGILVANSNEAGDPKVSAEEIEAFKKKYGLSYFVETDLAIESCDELLDLIEESKLIVTNKTDSS